MARVIPLLLVLVVLWAMMDSPAGPIAAPSAMAAAAVLLVFFLTFGALSLDLVGRLAAVATGASVAALLGSLLGFYFPSDAVAYLWGKRTPLTLLACIALVTELLHHSGFFAHVGRWTVARARGDRVRVMVWLCVLTYLLSLLLNNLATILVLIPLSLRVASTLDFDPLPLVLGEVIASNLGGASTMVGDFPNMLIAGESGLGFSSFLLRLAPVCFVQLGLLLVWLSPSFRQAARGAAPGDAPATLGEGPWSPAVARRGLLILGGMVLGFVSGGWIGLAPAWVALAGGVLAPLLGGAPPVALLRRFPLDDLLFFSCLFLMVGAVSACGILDGLGAAAHDLWQRSPAGAVLAITWGAAILTSVLSAGPATALLVHVLPATVVHGPGGRVVWWALSLGVCAGSSATLTGATAGPVAASLLERQGHALSFDRFARTGVPVMLLFLLVSSLYLVLLLSC